MDVGVPRELKDGEYRVGLVPSGVHALVEEGSRVWVEKGAGEGAGFPDEEYAAAGARIAEHAGQVYERAELIVKVKEPIREEYARLRSGQIVFTYLHLASLPELTCALLDSRATGVAYETISDARGGLPLLTPMSEIAGRMSVVVGNYFLQKGQGGRGVLMGGVPGVSPARVVIIGAGTVGTNAAKMAMGMGAQVHLLDVDLDRLRHLDDLFFGRVESSLSNAYNIAEAARHADLLVGAVLRPGATAPKLVTRAMIAKMQPGSVVVDVAVDQGGCFETTRPTSHSHPVYQVDRIVHYCVTNMPGAVPRTSTVALTNATLPYVKKIAARGLKQALAENPLLRGGINTYGGHVVCQAVADSQGLPYADLNQLMEKPL